MYATTAQITTELIGEVERNQLVICEAPNGCGKTIAMCAALIKLLLSDTYLPPNAETCHALVLCPNNDSAYFIYKIFLQLCANTVLTGTLVMPKHVTTNTAMSSLVNVNIVVAPLTIFSVFNERHLPSELTTIKFIVLTDCFRTVGAWLEYSHIFKQISHETVKIIGLTAKLNAVSKDMCHSICELLAGSESSLCTKVLFRLFLFDS